MSSKVLEMEIRIGARVTCRGGWVGVVVGVVVEPSSHVVTHLVIGGEGLKDRPVLLPLDSMGTIAADRVHAPMSTTTLREMPRAQGRSLSSGVKGQLLDAHTKVTVENQRGHISGFVLDDLDKRLDRLLVVRGMWPFKSKVVVLPESLRLWPTGELVVQQPIIVPKEAVASSDEEMEGQLSALLANREPFTNSNRFRLAVTVKDGRVELSGNVRFPDDKRESEDILRTLSGPRTVSSSLVADTELEMKLAHLLAHDDRTGRLRFRASSFLGQVSVSIWGNDQALKPAIEAMAKAIPGVLSVAVRFEEPPTPLSYTVVPPKSYTSVDPPSESV